LWKKFLLPYSLLAFVFDRYRYKNRNVTNGYGLYDLPLLVSFQRSGTNWTRYVIEFLTKRRTPGHPKLVETGRFVIDRAHEGYAVMHKHKRVILVLRDYKECIIRDRGREFDSARSVEAFLRNSDGVEQYCKNIEAFDRHRGDKLLIYYDNLLTNPELEIKKIAAFFDAPQERFEELLERLDYHKKQSIAFYELNKKSITGGAQSKLKWHAAQKLDDAGQAAFDSYFEKRLKNLYKKYLSRYR